MRKVPCGGRARWRRSGGDAACALDGSRNRWRQRAARGFLRLWWGYIGGGAVFLGLAVVSTARVWSRPGVVGLLYDWSIPGTGIGIQRLLATSWSAYNPTNLGSFSIFGQGPVWEYCPLVLTYLGVSPGTISRLVLVGPIVASGLGAMVLAWCVMRRHGDGGAYARLWALLIALVYVCCGDGFFVMSDGALPLMWFYVAVPWVLALAMWASAPDGGRWRLIPLGLTIGAAVTVLQFSWWLLPASTLLYLGSGRSVHGLRRKMRHVVLAVGIPTAAAITVNVYWMLHLAWVEALRRGLVAATVGGNSGLDYASNAPAPAQAFGLTGSVPTPSGSLLANSPAAWMTFLLPFVAVTLLLVVVIVRRMRRLEVYIIAGFVLFAALSSGEQILGGVVGTIWTLAVMSPFRGFVHFELISAALLCALMASAVSYGPQAGRVAGRILVVVAVAGLALPWMAGDVGGNGHQSGQPQLRTFEVARADQAKLLSLEKGGVGLLNVPTSASVWYWSQSRSGRYVWRPGGVNRTVEYTLGRELANVSTAPSRSPAEVGWFEGAPFSAAVSSGQLAKAMGAWDLSEVRVSRRAAAWIPQVGLGGGPVPASEALAKLKPPYFVPDGVTRDASYFRVVGVRMAWAQCLQHCAGRRIVSSNATSVLNLASPSSVIRIAVVDTGDTAVSCHGGRTRITSGVGQELVVRAFCPSRRLVLGRVSQGVDGYFDVVGVLGILGWVALMLWWRRRPSWMGA